MQIMRENVRYPVSCYFSHLQTSDYNLKKHTATWTKTVVPDLMQMSILLRSSLPTPIVRTQFTVYTFSFETHPKCAKFHFMETVIKSSSLLRMLAAALLAALTLVTVACNGDDEQKYYINGTIDSTTYTKSGYLLPTVAGPLTQLIAADSLAEYLAGTDFWYIAFTGTTTGTYTSSEGASIAFYLENSESYFGSDVTISVTTYSSTEVAGTFSGTLHYSEDSVDHPVQGEFRLLW